MIKKQKQKQKKKNKKKKQQQQQKKKKKKKKKKKTHTFKIFFLAGVFETRFTASGYQILPSLFKYDPMLTFDLFTQRSTLSLMHLYVKITQKLLKSMM